MNIVPPKIPTDQEMIKIAEFWWEDFIGINFLDYNEKMVQNTMPFHTIKVSSDKIKDLLEATDRGGLAVQEAARSIEAEIYRRFRTIPYKNDFFIKLITRSPKDAVKVNRFSSMNHALIVIAHSMRCFEDLVMLHYIDKCLLIFRPFYDIPKSEEWRAFVKDRQITGISQYHYLDKFQYENITVIETEIRNYIKQEVISNMSVDTYCLDLWVKNDGIIRVIETNPYHLSDPCLFIHHENLDGSIRWIT